MANVKWSNTTYFPTALPLTGAELFVGLQSGINVQFPLSTNILPYINANASFLSTSATTNSLSQGSTNLYLSTNGGTTYQNISGSLVVGNILKANTTGGQLIDSGIAASNIVLNNGGSYNINAATVTNGVYTTGSYANPSWITSLDSSKLTGTIPNAQTTGTSANTPNTLVLRDGSGNFSAGTITSNLNGNSTTVTNGVYTTGSYADPSWITSLSASKITGTIPNAQTTGTSANTPNTLVLRDGSGNFSAGTITASLSGNATTVTNGVYTTGSYADPSWITSLNGSKLVASSVTITQLADNCVNGFKLLNNAVSVSKIAPFLPMTILGNSTGSTTNPTYLTASQTKTLLSLDTASSPQFTGLNLSGLVASSPVVTDASKNLATVSAPLTYTPTIGDGTHNFITSTASGTYYKLGPLLFLQVNITWTGLGSAIATSTVQISLPSVIGASSGVISGSIGYNSGIAFPGVGGFLTIDGSSGNNYVIMHNIQSGFSPALILVSNCSNSGQIQFSLLYWTN